MTPFLIAAAILALAAVFEGTEAAFLSLTTARAHALAKRDPRAELALNLKREPHRLLSTLLLVQTVLHLAASSLVAVAAERLYGTTGVAVAATAMVFIVLVFANLIPKAVGMQHPERLALPMARPARFIMTVFLPVVWAADKLMRLVAGRRATLAADEEEVRALAQVAAAGGGMEEGERVLIERVFLFNDITAADALTPREQMATVSASLPLPDCLSYMDKAGYSRYPVVGKNGTVTGVVHVKDVLAHLAAGPAERFAATAAGDIAGPVKFVGEDQPIDDLLREMKRGRTHLAIVLNKGGAVAGLITMEDLIEELVGEIADESDIDEHIVKRVSKRVVLVHGDLEISSVNRFLNVNLAEDGHRTVGRLILSVAKDQAEVGDSYRLADNLTAEIEAIQGRRLTRVRLIKSE